jgi:hypothetical protein
MKRNRNPEISCKMILPSQSHIAISTRFDGSQIVPQATGQMFWERVRLDIVLLMCSSSQDSMTDLKCHSGCTCRLGSDLWMIAEEMWKSCRICCVMADWPCCSRAADNRDHCHRMHESDENEILPMACNFETGRLMRSKLSCGFSRNMHAVLNDRPG